MYGFHVKLNDSFDDAVQKVTAELSKEGFGVLTEIDISATFRAKLGIDTPPYHILGACNPALARQALEADPDIGLLLPCNVVVRANEEGGVTVGFMDPVSVLGLIGQKGVDEIATTVRAKLEKVRDAISA